jgi:drug/metabolite transporter (DMT)-like permease
MGSFVALSAIWGASFALIKIGVSAGVPPVQVALWRCLFGALALCAGCVVRRVALPRDAGTWGHAAVVATLMNAVPFTVLALGERQVSSVLAGVLNATTPLTTLLFGLVLLPAERLTARRLAGLVLGFAGVACLLRVWRVLPGIGSGAGVDSASGVAALLGGLACLGATLCYGAGFSYIRRWFARPAHSATSLCAAQLVCATAELAMATPVLSGPPHWPGWPAAAALTTLGAVGSGYAYILNLRVVRAAGATAAATVTYVVPVWSTAIGALLLGELVGWHTMAGALLVIAGVGTVRSPGRQERHPRPIGSPESAIRADSGNSRGTRKREPRGSSSRSG